jgi:signal transduction histidine kinase
MILRDNVNRFDDETRQRFSTIRQSAQMMGQLINDLLAFSRLGRKEITPSRLDMEGLLDDVWQELQVIHPERKMTLEVGPMPPAFGDRMLIKQVLLNLLSNAIKYGGLPPRIEVGATLEEDQVRYWVRDNGDGIKPALQGKLFKEGVRLHVREEGYGLGLAIVRRIVERLGGQVGVQSTGKPGEGATFWFTLHAVNDRDAASPASAPSPSDIP